MTTVASAAGQSVITVPISNTALVKIGAPVTGTNVPAGAVVTAVSGTNVTISIPIVTTIPIGATISIGNGTIGGAGSMTVTAPITGVNGATALNGLTVTGPGTTSFLPSNGINPLYAGTTIITGGATYQLNAPNELPAGAAVILGAPTAAAALTAFGSLDLQGFSQAIAGLIVNSDASAATDTININTAATLTVNGNVTFGANFSTTDATNATFTGGGTFTMASPVTNGLFQVGNATTTANIDAVTVNMTGLGTVNINAGATGVVRVGDFLGTAGTAVGADTWSLGTNNTIIASELSIGGESGQNANMTLNLGSGTNVIKADTVNLGAFASTTTALRGNGILTWAPAVTSGTLTLTNQAGAATVVNMVNTVSAQGQSETALFDTGTHSATILISTLTMSAKSASSGNATSTFNFGNGNLTIASLLMTNRSGANTGALASTMNLTGGTVSIGAITMAQNSVATTSNATAQLATLTVGGGAVTVGSAINMGFASGTATNVITSAINVTGGALIVSGGIAKGNNTGIANASLNLNGGTLDLGGSGSNSAIGTSALPITTTFAAGTLKNLSEFDGGAAAIVKTTTGTLIVPTANGYTGATSVTAGILDVSNSGALGATTAGTIVSAGATLQLDGGVNLSNEPLTISGVGAGGIGAINNVNGNGTVGTLVLTGNTTIGSGTPGNTLTIGTFSSTLITSLAFVGAGNVSVTSGFGNSPLATGELATQFFQGTNAGALASITPDGKPDDLLTIQTQQAPYVG